MADDKRPEGIFGFQCGFNLMYCLFLFHKGRWFMGIILVACVFITRRVDFSSKNTAFNKNVRGG